MSRLTAALAAALLLAGCVKEISSEERLDRETNTGPVKATLNAQELAKVNCLDAPQGLAKARNENKPEGERLTSYLELFESLRARSAVFEDSMSRNPDLAYQPGSQELVAAHEACIQQTADVRVEFESFVRELVEVPTVQEIKGGNTVTVARLDFTTLREAIQSLSPDDKEQLLNRVANAEKKVEVKADAPKKKGR